MYGQLVNNKDDSVVQYVALGQLDIIGKKCIWAPTSRHFKKPDVLKV